jgi:porphobilinogen synthase
MELLTSIKRAGANQIITYHARDAARWLREEYGVAAAREPLPV